MKKSFIMVSRMAVFLALVLVQAGCEDNEDGRSYNEAGDISALAISPASATLDYGEIYVTFTAVGGTGPYSWSVHDESLGTLDTSTAVNVVYNRIGVRPGANIIHLQDANNWIAEAMVTHTTNVIVVPTNVTGSVTSD